MSPHLHVIRRDFDGIGDGELLYVEGSEETETIDCTPDAYDIEYGKTAADLATRYLKEEGPYLEPDVMPGTPSWYSGRDDAETGTEWYIGLEGFTTAECDRIE